MKPVTLTYDYENALKLDLFMPDNECKALFIYMHGGGLTGGDRTAIPHIHSKLAEDGIAVASLDYRMYPNVRFPVFIEDCAKAIDYMLNELKYGFKKVYVGGSSAGAYLSMMLLFNKEYLGKYGIDPLLLDGWILDAGQPTTHFNVLNDRGYDSRLVRVDDAAPLFYIDKDFVPTRSDGKLPMVLNISASNDMTCRLEQLKLLNATMLHFGWQKDRLRFEYMDGYSHCEYNDHMIFVQLIESVILYDA